MAEEQITVEWIATAKQMLEAIQKVDKGLERQEKAMQKLANTSKKGAEDAKGSFNKLEQELKENEAVLKRLTMGTQAFVDQRAKVDGLRASMVKLKGELTGVKNEVVQIEAKGDTFGDIKSGMLGAMGSAYALVTAFQKVAEAQRDIVKTGADAAVELDTLARKFQIQADLTDPERQAATVEILKQSSAAGVKGEAGFQTATALASTGFKDPVTSGALKTALEGMQGTSFTGSPEQYVESTSQALSAYGIDKTPQALAEINTRLAGIFKETAVQAVDLTDFAKNASVLEKRMGIGEGLAGFAALREIGTAESASMGMRQVTLGMMAPDTTGVEGMKAAGLKPEQLDMVGETFGEAVQTLKTAIEALPKEKQAPALMQMFGAQGIAASMNVMAKADRIKELELVQNDPAALARNFETASGGMQAGRNRLENQELIDALPRGQALNELDMGLRGRDARQQRLEQVAATDVGATGASLARVASNVLNPIDETLGTDMIGGGSQALGAVFSRFFGASDKKQDELIRLQREANELARANAQRPAPQRAALPNERPRVAPMPGATVP